MEKILGSQLPDYIPNRFGGEALAHVGCDLSPFAFDVWVNQTKQEFSISFGIPGARHEEADKIIDVVEYWSSVLSKAKEG
jgi:hypothetical protein